MSQLRLISEAPWRLNERAAVADDWVTILIGWEIALVIGSLMVVSATVGFVGAIMWH